jgi:hypothetical protein
MLAAFVLHASVVVVEAGMLVVVLRAVVAVPLVTRDVVVLETMVGGGVHDPMLSLLTRRGRVSTITRRP